MMRFHAPVCPLRELPRFALAPALAVALVASGTQTWEMDSYNDFLRGHFDGISLSREGRLSLAPKVDTVFTSDQPVIWSVARASDGTLYAATGHRGRVYRIDPAGKSSLLWTAEQPEDLRHRRGCARAWSMPAPRPMARCIASRTARPRSTSRPRRATSGRWPWRPMARFSWAPAIRARSSASTAAGKGELYYDTGQSHITGLAVDPQGRLLAGTEPNGILYRITAKDKAFVLYDSPLPEIRAIVPMPDGTVYAAALGGSVAKRAQAAAAGRAGPDRHSDHRLHHHHRGSAGRRRTQTARHQSRSRSR